jgi:hypothetical protein
MAPFLAEPLLEELRGAAETAVPLHDARRLLEVLVPLAYRPAIKAALLDAGLLPLMADILGEPAGGRAMVAWAGREAMAGRTGLGIGAWQGQRRSQVRVLLACAAWSFLVGYTWVLAHSSKPRTGRPCKR